MLSDKWRNTRLNFQPNIQQQYIAKHDLKKFKILKLFKIIHTQLNKIK
jgi:hypothetical protein